MGIAGVAGNPSGESFADETGEGVDEKVAVLFGFAAALFGVVGLDGPPDAHFGPAVCVGRIDEEPLGRNPMRLLDPLSRSETDFPGNGDEINRDEGQRRRGAVIEDERLGEEVHVDPFSWLGAGCVAGHPHQCSRRDDG